MEELLLHPSQCRTERRRRGEREEEKHTWRTRREGRGAGEHVRIRHSKSPSGNVGAASKAPRAAARPAAGEAGRLEQHLWVGAGPSASWEPPCRLTPSCSIALSSGPSLAPLCLQAGLSQRPGLRAPASQDRARVQHGPCRASAPSWRGAASENGSRRLAGANPGLVLLHPAVGPGTCCLLLRHGSASLRPSRPTRTYLSKADPWLWLLVRREKTLRSLRGRVGGDEGGVKPTSGGLSQEG